MHLCSALEQRVSLLPMDGARTFLVIPATPPPWNGSWVSSQETPKNNKKSEMAPPKLGQKTTLMSQWVTKNFQHDWSAKCQALYSPELTSLVEFLLNCPGMNLTGANARARRRPILLAGIHPKSHTGAWSPRIVVRSCCCSSLLPLGKLAPSKIMMMSSKWLVIASKCCPLLFHPPYEGYAV